MECFLCSKISEYGSIQFERIAECKVPSSKKPLEVVLRHLGNCIKRKLIFHSNSCVCSNCYKNLAAYDKLMLNLLCFQKKLTNQLQKALSVETYHDGSTEHLDRKGTYDEATLTIEEDDEIIGFSPVLQTKDEVVKIENVSIEDHIIHEMSYDEDISDHSEEISGRKRSGQECFSCGIVFNSKAQLQNHIMEAHNAKIYACHICGAVRRDEEYLELHMNLHEGKTENECRYCSKRFSRPVNTIRHMRKHWDKKKYQCEKCGERFSQDNLLYNHRLRHEAEENPLICSICNQSFKSRKTFNHHMLIHQKDRPRYKCSLCSKSFTERYTLKMHMKIHNTIGQTSIVHGEPIETEAAISVLIDGISKEYPCIICSMMYDAKDKLEQHLQTEHDVILK